MLAWIFIIFQDEHLIVTKHFSLSMFKKKKLKCCCLVACQFNLQSYVIFNVNSIFSNERFGGLRARLFRRIEWAKRPFFKSQKSGNVWLGEIRGIAFWNQQKFAFQERQLPVAISVSRDLQIAIPPKIFAENQK